MPLYEFDCPTCGCFEKLRTLAQREQPLACPSCGAIAKRIFAPARFSLSASLPLRDSSNTEPQRVKRDREPSAPRYRTQPQGRPWMIGH